LKMLREEQLSVSWSEDDNKYRLVVHEKAWILHNSAHNFLNGNRLLRVSMKTHFFDLSEILYKTTNALALKVQTQMTPVRITESREYDTINSCLLHVFHLLIFSPKIIHNESLWTDGFPWNKFCYKCTSIIKSWNPRPFFIPLLTGRDPRAYLTTGTVLAKLGCTVTLFMSLYVCFAKIHFPCRSGVWYWLAYNIK
jgi:hypothetical protein